VNGRRGLRARTSDEASASVISAAGYWSGKQYGRVISWSRSACAASSSKNLPERSV